MRCLTIAEALVDVLEDNRQICFFCADEQSAALVESHGFQARVLGTNYQDMEEELLAWEKLLVSEGWYSQKVILVDSYYVTDAYLQKLRHYGKVYLLDDMQEHAYPVDVVINYNAFAEESIYYELYNGLYDTKHETKDDVKCGTEYDGKYDTEYEAKCDTECEAKCNTEYDVKCDTEYNAKCGTEYEAKYDTKHDRKYHQRNHQYQGYHPIETKYYVGSAYVPVRQQFLNQSYKVAKEVKQVLITTGGGDADNIAGAILGKIYRKDMDFHVVTGRYNPHIDALKMLEQTCKGVHIHHDVKDMAGLMKKCDLAITAGGTTIYELAALGVPFLCFSYAKNQEALTEYIGAKHIAGFFGAYHKDKQTVLEKLPVLFAEYCEQYNLRKECFEKEQEMIDGKGAMRLAKILL